MNRIVSLLLSIACALTASALGGATARADGEPVDGFPSWSERVIWVYTNRARADPAADLASCDRCGESACYAPTAPLEWSHELARPARLQSALLMDIGGGGWLMHDTPCDLVDDIATIYTPGACDGSVACACQGGVAECAGTCERFDARVRRFGTYPLAENIAGNYSPLAAFYAWLHEPWDRTDCARGLDSMERTNGHRQNLLLKGPALGVGHAGSLYTQDFGFGSEPSGIVAGVHTPESGATVELRANWYDTAGPARASVNVDGTCHAMSLERGTPENGTHLATVSLGSGCHRYFFTFEDAAGTERTWPTTGSYQIGCGSDFAAGERPPRCGCTPSCGGRACGDDGCGGSCGACGSDESCDPSGACVCSGPSCAPDAGSPTTGDGGPGSAGDAGWGPSSDAGTATRPDAGTAPPPPGASRTLVGGCRAAPNGPGVTWAWIAAVAFALAARRRR